MNAAAAAQADEETEPTLGAVRIGMLVYADGQTGVCFADDFLDTLARTTNVRLDRTLEPVKLSSDQLFEYPFIVMTGQDEFTLSDHEKQQLRDYIQYGGFVLASAGCSSEPWAESFRGVMRELFGEGEGEDVMQPITTEHPIFHTVHDIEYLDVRGETDQTPAIFACEIGDVVRVVFSPMGLNDTANAGGDCCCCGGNEIRNARLINTNILAYALTH